MSTKFKTKQESFWSGEFGNEYTDRNLNTEKVIASNLSFWSRVLERTESVGSVIEFGANRGLNMTALRSLVPNIDLSAIEINQRAVGELEKIGGIKIYPQSILQFQPDHPRDVSFTQGVLMHIDPNEITHVYDLLYQASSRYILIAEYYNPVPQEVSYRGNREKLFKRDFAGEMMDRFSDLHLVDYAFIYRRDINFPQDDITWFLMEKRS